MTRSVSPEQIDKLLPQTQCGLCGFGGCMPYAEALVNKDAAINLCPPGGVKTLKKLGELLTEDVTPFITQMETSAKPPMLAVIREAECIGCTKCIQACPVDAIIGTAKQMHAIIADECTGCELCVAPCPVDCIDMLPLSGAEITNEKSSQFRKRYYARQERLFLEKQEKDNKKESSVVSERKSYIQNALARVRAKKLGV